MESWVLQRKGKTEKTECELEKWRFQKKEWWDTYYVRDYQKISAKHNVPVEERET